MALIDLIQTGVGVACGIVIQPSVQHSRLARPRTEVDIYTENVVAGESVCLPSVRLFSFSLTFLFACSAFTQSHTFPCLGVVNMKTTFFLAAGLSLLHITLAATSPVFVGCYAPGLLDNVVANLLSGVANTLAFTNGATCAVSKTCCPMT